MTATELRAARIRALRAWAIAAPVFLLCSAVPSGGLLRTRGYVDVDLYGGYASGLLDGRLPYRDVFVEYPPGAFVALVPPAVAGEDHYRTLFKLLMALVALGGLWCLARLLVGLGAGDRRLALALGFVALSPLLMGSVWLNSYDAWPSSLTVAAALALASGWVAAGFVCLGLATTAKVYALALVVPAMVYALARGGRSAAARGGLAFLATTAVTAVPFVALSPDGVWASLRAQLERGLHIESLGAGILLAADRLGLYRATVSAGKTEARTRDLAGGLPDTLATAGTILLVAAVLAVWLVHARGSRSSPERLVTAFAAGVAAVLALSKVVSPQYAEWLLFLVPAVGGPAGVVATGIYAITLALAALWFHHYPSLYAVDGRVWLVLARDLLLVVIYGAVVLRLSTTMPSRSKTTRQAGSSLTAARDAAARAGS